MSNNQLQESDANEDINEEEVVQAILELGNDILRNLGVEDQIDDIGVFFGDAFYIQFFQVAFPEIDFSNIQEAGDEQQMAENLQNLIDLLGQQILRYDLSHITGEEIVQGNPEHCINLLQLVQEISVMVNNNQGAQSSTNPREGADDEGPEDADSNQMDEDEDGSMQQNLQQNDMDDDDEDEEEDEEAQIIQQKQAKKPQNTSNNQIAASAAKAQSSAKRGRSYSDDKRKGGNQFLDDIDISNEFNVNMDGDEDDEEDDEHMQMFQQQQQQQQNKVDQSNQSIKQQQQQQQLQQQMMGQYNQEDDDEDEDELDDNDMKMYEQFLAQNQQDQQQLAGGQKQQQQNHFDIEDDDEEVDGRDQQQDDGEDMEGDDQDIDLDNIDYEDLDPQILEIAEQMGVHPKEVLKQMLKMQNEGYGDEEDEDDNEEEMDEEELKEQLKQVNQMRQSPQKQQLQQQVQPAQPKQKQQQPLPHEMIPSNDDSYYSEGELLTRDKLGDRQTYSAPYIIFNDCFEDKLCDTESNQELDSAHTTTVLKNLEDQEQLAQQMNSANQQMIEQQQQQMLAQQKQQMQQRGNNQVANITSNSNKNNKSGGSNQKNNYQQQQNQYEMGGDDDDEDELDINVGQKLEQLKNQQQQDQMRQQQQQMQDQDQDDNENQDDGEGEEEDDDNMLVDLDQLDDANKQMLLEYLQQEYDKNPAQFPFPKELLEQQQMQLKNQQNNKRQETDSVFDIKSDEMIVEDHSQHQNQQIDGGQIEGGEEEIEGNEDDNEQSGDEEGDLTPEQQQQLQMLLQQQQMQQQNQDYGDENDRDGEEDNGDQLDEIQQQMLHNYQMQQQIMMEQQQQQRMKKKPVKGTKKGIRPKSAGTKKKPPTYQAQQNLLSQEQIMQQEQLLQQQQLLGMLQQEGVDIENLDPNILQQLLIAQNQQHQQSIAPKPLKRKSSSTRKKVSATTTSANRNLTKLQPYQMPKSMKVLGPITPSTQYKSFNTNRSYNQTFSKKKRKKSATKKQALTLNPSQAQYMGMPNDQQNQIDHNVLMMQQQQLQNMAPAQLEMPVLSEDYLNQLSEEQLQQLLEHQQLMMIQQQQQQQIQMANQPIYQQKKSIRPKSAKSSKQTIKPATKVPQTYANYYQPYMNNLKKKSSTLKGKKPKKKKQSAVQSQYVDHQGVMMNNYFPALEAANSQLTDDGNSSLTKDQKYPKFSHEIVNNPNAMNQMNNQDPIDEVSQEHEDAESQENIQQMSNLYANPQQYQQNLNYNDDDQNEDDEGTDMNDQLQMQQQINMQQQQDQDIEQDNMDQDQQDPNDGLDEQTMNGQEQVELSDEQLIQLIQNAHNLTPDQQLQLQMILQQKMKNEMANDRAKSYQDIYNILMDNVQKAKDRLAHLGHPVGSIDDVEETDRRIMRQKQEFEALYRQYHHEMKQKETRKKNEGQKTQKKVQREMKIQSIKERKFQEELLNHQKSLNYKRNAQQVRLCQKVYKLASELEKSKLLNEKKEFKENLVKKKQQSRMMVDALENFYKNMITMLKEKIENEKFERRIASQAQQQAMSRMKRELNNQKKQEVERYLQLLKQEDEKYDFESTNIHKMENDIIKLYKK